MYNTKTAVVNNEEFTSKYMPVGINDDVVLKNVEIKKSPTGLDYIEFIFADKNGREVTMTEWQNKKNMWIKTDEDLQHRDDIQFGRIMQILNCYIDTMPEVELESFASMIAWVESKLNSIANRSDVKLRLKVIYDKNGYTRVSNNGIFVEPMSKTETQIKKFARDLFERPIVADKETNSDPLTINSIPETETQTGADDLPF